MSFSIKLRELQALFLEELHGPIQFISWSSRLGSQVALGLSTDIHTLQPGQLFLALRDENLDRHQFVEAAIANGAIAAIVEQPAAVEVPQILVPNTLKAYQVLGRWWRNQFTMPMIAVTGSVGKNTTKELIAAALRTAGSVLNTQANVNSSIEIPKTLLNLGSEYDFTVLDIGRGEPEEIARLTHLVRPNIGVITNIETAHIERPWQGLPRAECKLLAEMNHYNTGVAILNAENPLLLETAQAVWQGTRLTYGLSAGDLRGKLIDPNTIEVDGIRYPLPLPGVYNGLNFLATIAVVRALNLDDIPLRNGISVNLFSKPRHEGVEDEQSTSWRDQEVSHLSIKQIASAEVDISYNTLLVEDPEVETSYPESGNLYDCFPGSVVFLTCSSCSHALIEVWQAEEIQIKPDTLRAIVVPFPVGKSGVVVKGLFTLEEEYLHVPIPEGRYALVYEIKRRDDEAYLNSTEYQDDQGSGLQGMFCRLTFVPQESVEPQVLRSVDDPYF